MLGSIAYHFQPPDFIPRDINDLGWVVGETQEYFDGKLVTGPVLMRDGKETPIGNFGGDSSAYAINRRGHVLICRGANSRNPTKSPMSRLGYTDVSGWTTCYFWDGTKSTLVGDISRVGRLLDNDQFLVAIGRRNLKVKIKNGQVQVTALPLIPSKSKFLCDTNWADMNQDGIVVGSTNFGWSFSHAVEMDTKGHTIDLHPNVEMHTGWGAEHITESGTVMGEYSFDSSVGGKQVWIWKNGKVSNLVTQAPGDKSITVQGFNEHDQAVGSRSLYESGSTINRLDNQEIYPPHIATPTSHAMVWGARHAGDLNDLSDVPTGVVLCSATRINNKGWIIGTCIRDNKRLGFVLTPLSN